MKTFLFTLACLSLAACSPSQKAETSDAACADIQKIRVLDGDNPDPSLVLYKGTYYMVHSSFDYCPGLIVYESTDLVNWKPCSAALTEPIGSVWAPDISVYNGRFYIYFPTMGAVGRTNMVVYADNPHGPWSKPIDLKVGGIDPEHVVGEDGQRYLLMSGGDLHPLAPDGLSITGTPIYIYKGWPIPEEWDIESFSLEGINLKKIGDYYYLLAAEGGTAGPPTGHMVVQARSRSVEGPFENAPNNPLLRTQSPDEQWWSQGHGQVIEGLHGELFMTFHAYEKGFLTLGRQNLICQLEMGKDGWLQLKKGKIDLPQPIRKTEKGISDFVWQSYKEGITDRAVITSDSIVLKAEGKTPLDSSPLLLRAGDHSYEVVARLELSDPNTLGGLILFYDNQRNFGFGFGREMPLRFRNGAVSRTRSLFDIKPDASGKTVVWVKIRNTNHIISGWYSPDGKAWHKYPWGYDMSGFHHNTLGEFLSVRPGIFAAGDGAVTATQLRYIKVN